MNESDCTTSLRAVVGREIQIFRMRGFLLEYGLLEFERFDHFGSPHHIPEEEPGSAIHVAVCELGPSRIPPKPVIL